MDGRSVEAGNGCSRAWGGAGSGKRGPRERGYLQSVSRASSVRLMSRICWARVWMGCIERSSSSQRAISVYIPYRKIHTHTHTVRSSELHAKPTSITHLSLFTQISPLCSCPQPLPNCPPSPCRSECIRHSGLSSAHKIQRESETQEKMDHQK